MPNRDSGDPHQKLVEYADKILDDTFTRLERAAEPVWQGQSEYGKSLTALASSALVLSISVAQFLAGRGARPEWTWLLPVAWVLFGVTVTLGAGQHTWLGAARSTRLHLELKRGEIRGTIRSIDPSADGAGARFDEILSDAFSSSEAQVEDALKTYQVRSGLMFWSFAIGLFMLIVFAIKNLF